MEEQARLILAKKKNFFGNEVMQRLKKLSREPIVFTKAIQNLGMLKWTTVVEDAFVDLN